MSVEVQRFDDAQAFLDEAGPFLAETEDHEANRICQAIGYEPVVEVDRWTFEPVGST